MGVLFFDDTVRKIIKNMIAFAEKNKITLSTLKKMVKGDVMPVGADPDRNLIIGTHRIVFSIEQQPFGWCRHISISVLKTDGVSDLPSIPAVLEIIKEFGFEHKELGKRSEFFNYWIEEISKNEHAINVVEKID